MVNILTIDGKYRGIHPSHKMVNGNANDSMYCELCQKCYRMRSPNNWSYDSGLFEECKPNERYGIDLDYLGVLRNRFNSEIEQLKGDGILDKHFCIDQNFERKLSSRMNQYLYEVFNAHNKDFGYFSNTIGGYLRIAIIVCLVELLEQEYNVCFPLDY
jgi:hypothetical protein